METGKFLKLLIPHRIYLFNNENTKFNISQFMLLAKMTKDIDFGCKFNSQDKGCSKNKEHEMCCCTGCFDGVGMRNKYDIQIILEANTIDRIASLFQEKTGFWKEGVGCSLPREYRSVTCLSYHCNPRLKMWEETLIDKIRHPYEISRHDQHLIKKIREYEEFAFKIKDGNIKTIREARQKSNKIIKSRKL